MSLAVIKTGGKQYVVKPKAKLKIEKLTANEGSAVEFNDVLLAADEKAADVKVGMPVLKQAKVTAKVVRHGKTQKVTGYHYKAKTRNKKKFGHRQQFTEIEVTDIKA